MGTGSRLPGTNPVTKTLVEAILKVTIPRIWLAIPVGPVN
jgi:hypothetical protein